MKNIVGTPAIGANFFSRPREIEKILNSIQSDNNLQIAAPRRVGKTSILHYLKDKEVGGHLYVYVDTEDVNNEQDFYKKLLKAILKIDCINKSPLLNKFVQAGEKFFNKVKSVKVMGNGIDFNEDHDDADYYEELLNFLYSLQLENNQKLILLIDEYPQTILNIIESCSGDTTPAVKFLQSNRRLRQLPEILGRVQFIYTGSIGLNHTVAAINASAFVNDLNTLEVDPLTTGEASAMIKELINEKSFTINDTVIKYLLSRIQWLIPFHVQLFMHELFTQCYGKESAGKEDIDKSFDQMVSSRNNNHFDHYYSRLKSQFKNNSFHYAEAIMSRAAEKGSITKAELYDMAVEFQTTECYRQVINVLTYDGYLNNNLTHNIYEFNSPVLRMWWKKYICK